jgi:hypothetical protein
MLMSLQAGAVGVDLTAASEALFVQLPQDVAQLKQAEARIHRKGQAHPCQVHFLVSAAFEDGETLAWERLRAQGNAVDSLHDGVDEKKDEKERDALPVHHFDNFSSSSSSSSSSHAPPHDPVSKSDAKPSPPLKAAPTPKERPETSLGSYLEARLKTLVASANKNKDVPLRPIPEECFFEVGVTTIISPYCISIIESDPC